MKNDPAYTRAYYLKNRERIRARDKARRDLTRKNKNCIVCGTTLIGLFAFVAFCSEVCRDKKDREREISRRSHLAEYRRSERGKEKKRLADQRHPSTPEQRRARRKVQYAVKKGWLIRTPCVVCGNPKSEGHHPDHSKPLEVIWLCKPHHVDADRALNRNPQPKRRQPMNEKMTAEVAYSVYAKMSNNKNVRGEPLPLWSELDDANQEAWIAAVTAARNPRLSDLADKPLVDAFQRLRLALGNPTLTPENEGDPLEIPLIDYAIDRLAATGATGKRAAA